MNVTLKTGIACLVDTQRIREAGVSDEELCRYLPSYILHPRDFTATGAVKKVLLRAVNGVVITLATIVLRPRREKAGSLDIHEVERVYRREARTYDRKHRLTTRGMDTAWRRWAGAAVAAFGRGAVGPVRVLDLCSGTGLSVSEMVTVLRLWNMQAAITGFDYNEDMLRYARSRRLSGGGITVNFERGDAMNMVAGAGARDGGLASFAPRSFDVATQMFGIGGIADPVAVFRNVLALLAPGGHYFLIDMHRPVPELPGEFPFLTRWIRAPFLEHLAYHEHTIPVILNRLWGWRDTTMDFYYLPLVTLTDEAGGRWGFRVLNFVTESQRWWLDLPFMNIARICVEKVPLTRDEAERRERILSVITAPRSGQDTIETPRRESRNK